MGQTGYESHIAELISMFEEKDADGIDKFLYRYEDKGFGMLAIALYHGLKEEIRKVTRNTCRAEVKEEEDEQ